MYVKKWIKMEGEPGSGGSGAAATPAPAPAATPSPAPAPVESSTSPAAPPASSNRIADMAKSIGNDLFGRAAEPSPAPPPQQASRPAPAPTPAAEPAPPAQTPAPAATPVATPPAVDVNVPPETWRAEAKALWSNLPEQARAEIHKREQDVHRGIAQYRDAAQRAQGFMQAIAPVQNELRQLNVDPKVFVGKLTEVHASLGNGAIPIEKRAEFAINLMRGYGIDLDGYFRQRFAAAAPSDGSSTPAPAALPPEVVALRDEINAVKTHLTTAQQREAERQRATLEAELTKFAEDPAHPHFNDVADDIAVLLRGSQGKLTLQEAYDRAVFANPLTREKEMTRKLAEQRANEEKAARERAANARAATAANVSSGLNQGSSAAAGGSWEDTMTATMREIRTRKQ